MDSQIAPSGFLRAVQVSEALSLWKLIFLSISLFLLIDEGQVLGMLPAAPATASRRYQ